MNKEIFKGNWKEIKGQLKQQWGKLTDNDLLSIAGKHDEIFGILEKHYGHTKENIQQTLDKLSKGN